LQDILTDRLSLSDIFALIIKRANLLCSVKMNQQEQDALANVFNDSVELLVAKLEEISFKLDSVQHDAATENTAQLRLGSFL